MMSYFAVQLSALGLKKKKKLSFSVPLELQIPVSSLKAPDPSLFLGDPKLLINLLRNWLSHSSLFF